MCRHGLGASNSTCNDGSIRTVVPVLGRVNPYPLRAGVIYRASYDCQIALAYRSGAKSARIVPFRRCS